MKKSTNYDAAQERAERGAIQTFTPSSIQGTITCTVRSWDTGWNLEVVMEMPTGRTEVWCFSDWKHFMGHFGMMLALTTCPITVTR